MSENILANIVAIVGIAVGIMWTTYAPYLKKMKEEKIESFDKKYLVTAVIAFVGALVTAIPLLSGFDLEGATDMAALSILAIIYGATCTRATNRGIWK